jgi:uncharacterized protein (TIGR03435 family)
VAFGQSAAVSKPKFDISDVRLSAQVASPFLAAAPTMSGGVLRGDHYELRNATMLNLIQTAYGIDDTGKIVGGPNWLNTDRFDIAAKAPQSTTPETVKLMLQSLLDERFKLVVRMDSKPMLTYVLSAGNGPLKLKPADDSGESGCLGIPQNPVKGSTAGEIPYSAFSCHNLTMEEFTAWLRRTAGDLGGSAVNQTSLKGSWDFDIKWIPRRRLAAAGADAIGMTVFDAIDKQLGLKLELQRVPTPVIVVDSVKRVPSDNASEVTTSLPAPPVEFEVASIRPSAPGTTHTGDVQNGRIDWRAWSLRSLIFIAWNIGGSNDMLVGPKFLESAKFDIAAKAATQLLDLDDVRPMLRALLVERFKLAMHLETRPVSVYTLTAAKPKMQKADPSRRSECREGPGDDGKDPRIANPILNRLVTCQNTTMAQLAEQFQGFGRGYLESSVVEGTELGGAYDFTLSFSGSDVFPSGGNATVPGGALSLFEAVDKQLGLKLEREKRPVPVLVIDHIEEKPTEN